MDKKSKFKAENFHERRNQNAVKQITEELVKDGAATYPTWMPSSEISIWLDNFEIATKKADAIRAKRQNNSTQEL